MRTANGNSKPVRSIIVMQEADRFILQHFVVQAPTMLVCLGCIVAAVALWRRAPTSSLLVLVASAVTIIALTIYPFAFVAAVRSSGNDAQSFARFNMISSFAWSVFRAAYLVALAVAVYLGRKVT